MRQTGGRFVKSSFKRTFFCFCGQQCWMEIDLVDRPLVCLVMECFVNDANTQNGNQKRQDIVHPCFFSATPRKLSHLRSLHSSQLQWATVCACATDGCCWWIIDTVVSWHARLFLKAEMLTLSLHLIAHGRLGRVTGLLPYPAEANRKCRLQTICHQVGFKDLKWGCIFYAIIDSFRAP